MLKIRETDSSFLPPRYLGGCWHKGENASSKVNTQGNTEQRKASQKQKKLSLWHCQNGEGDPAAKIDFEMFDFWGENQSEKVAQIAGR